jgi:hypothetical protein
MSTELLDLIRETQGDAIAKPASLRDIAHALERRGIFTAAIRVARQDVPRISWPGPAIVHFSDERGSAGHFVVLEPQRGDAGDLRIWDGLHGSLRASNRELAAAASGAVLLTAREEIRSAESCLPCACSVSGAWVAAVLALTAASLAFRWYLRRVRLSSLSLKEGVVR